MPDDHAGDEAFLRDFKPTGESAEAFRERLGIPSKEAILADFDRQVAEKGIRVPKRSRNVTIRFDEGDLAEARRQAADKGLPYQTYIKMLIREGLKRGA